jgi:hypothetical protein
MKSPFTGSEATIHIEWMEMTYRKESFRVLFHTWKCPDTGNTFEDEAFAALNYNQLVNQYRAKYALPFPEKIIAIRNKYAVSASKMSEILGFGTNSYRLYEDGEVPSLSNGKLIQLAENPKEFRKLVELCSTLDDKFKNKLNQRIEELLETERNENFKKEIEIYLLGSQQPGPLTGYTSPNLQKLTEMVVFFAEKMQPWKTKLNKLLFYADFAMYRKTGYSISGTSYRAIPMGPVPNNFSSLFEYMENNDQIGINCTTFSDGGIGEQFIAFPNRTFSSEIFSAGELDVLDGIAKRFADASTQNIVELSHNEKAWSENEKERNLIDYRYGFELVGV